MRRLQNEPAEFVRQVFRAEPDPWQVRALDNVAAHPRSAIRSGHGVGKSCMCAWCIWWFLFTRPFAKVVCTAPTIRQLYDVLWSELAKWLERSKLLQDLFEWQKTRIVFKAQPAQWFAAARTAAKPESLAGFHADNLLFVMDEASGIADELFEVAQGALTGRNNKLVLCSNPTRNSGFFKRAFHDERRLYATLKVSSLESGRVSREYGQHLIEQYGLDSDIVRVRVLGEFPKAQADGLIELEKIEAAFVRELPAQGEAVIGVDVARFGDDSTVLCARRGDCVEKIESYRKSDLMTTVGRILHMAKGMGQVQINVDDDGLGGGVTDRLREVVSQEDLPIEVRACHNGQRARDERHANFVTECYFALRERFLAGAISLPRNDELAAQLSTRRYKLNSRDQLILETKAEYKARYKRSPDFADALALAFAPGVTFSLPHFVPKFSYWH